MLSSKDFYTRFSPFYTQYATEKRRYLLAVDKFIMENVRGGINLADVGAGDGKRSLKISASLGIKSLTFIENSDGMIVNLRQIPGAIVICADISSEQFYVQTRHDIVLCLWNVLGHIAYGRRGAALKNLASLVNDDGVIFLDVNNRYNLAHYGLMAVARNIFRDIFLPRNSNGDFRLTLGTATGSIDTMIHLFSRREVERLIELAGLSIKERRFINYRTGKRVKTSFCGQLVYKLMRS